ncbi:RHS repeat-associated core domain-containing protein [Variovorax sp. J22G73]|jgi:RHS repeat-associated protein|uniref:RHS repeat-associated core domain-containing protein n=1 Tax=unclassified Variovorax TaxID=663243 RepID=UPI000D5E8EB4|nr:MULTISPECIES: RHS repeat-associated core domain-containing protein [unclassified Variovorax]MDM0006199.1 RHS repeat-associated core domain-containing protein [Variovorax sp. J22R203]MDM0097778.1 RHS repeat-associated core domain-containing protein [Variovorax sp. J22G73]
MTVRITISLGRKRLNDGEVGSGGQNSAGQAQYIYLPTANGPMPIAAVINGATFAVHSDHLNTPRKLSNASGQPVWQWSYSAFGEDKPTLAKNRFANLEVTPNPGTTNIADVKFNLRYPGQYSDEESGLFYNGYRTYIPTLGRYTQSDPIGLDGGWNRFGYVNADPLNYLDEDGLQARPPRAAVGPLSVSYGESVAAGQVSGLLSQIRRYDPSFTYDVVRPSRGSGSGYSRADVNILGSLLRGYERNQTCPRDGVQPGRLIGDQRGNVMVEPVGGRTVPRGPGGVDTHTLYPNGSNYMRLNPVGHANNPTPNGHGHAMGTGSGMSGQGPSLSPTGNIVPFTSSDAHWPIN